MKIYSILIIGLVATTSKAQNLTREMLNAYKVEHSIFFRLERIEGKKRLTYEIDPRDAVLSENNTSRSKILKHEIDDGSRLSVAGTNTSFNLLLNFYNPLKYGYRIASKTIDSPSSVAFESFYNEVFNLAKRLNPKVESTQSSHENVSTTISKANEEANNERQYTTNYLNAFNGINTNSTSTNKKRKSPRLQSNSLIDWALWYYQTIGMNQNGNARIQLQNRPSQTPNEKTINNLLTVYLDMEGYIYNQIDSTLTYELTGGANVNLYFESYLLQIYEELASTSTAIDFRKKVDQIGICIKKLKGYDDEAMALCDKIERTTFTYDERQPNSKENYFIDYTISKRTVYLEAARSIINKRAGLLDELKALLQRIDQEFIPSLAAPNATKMYVETVEVGKLKEIEIQLIESDFTIDNGKLNRSKDAIYSFDLLVSEYSSILAEFGLGSVFFPSIDIFNYSSSNNTVVKTSSKYYFSPMATLNLIPNIGKGQTFWMMQLGVGSSIDKPTIGIGTGFRVYNVRENVFRNFSVSAGCLGIFTRQLGSFVEGGTASQAELNQDLRYEIKFRPYIGLALNF